MLRQPCSAVQKDRAPVLLLVLRGCSEGTVLPLRTGLLPLPDPAAVGTGARGPYGPSGPHKPSL